MATKKGITTTDKPSPLVDLDALLGSSSNLDPELVDAGLLWMVMVACLRRGAAIHLGMNRAGTSFVLTVYDGDFPRKEYIDTIDRLHHVMAALVKVYGKKPLDPEWAARVEMYFP